MSAALDLDHFRDRLLEERKRAADALEHLQQENQGQLEDEREEIQSDNHPGDMATGTYGTCSNCGEPIGAERLEAVPWTTQCIDCKRKEERG